MHFFLWRKESKDLLGKSPLWEDPCHNQEKGERKKGSEVVRVEKVEN
jgi:hypothetical protein